MEERGIIYFFRCLSTLVAPVLTKHDEVRTTNDAVVRVVSAPLNIRGTWVFPEPSIGPILTEDNKISAAHRAIQVII
jgi:hypothetical protein